MRVGISTASLFNRVPTETTFDIFRQMRVDTAEIFLNTYSEYEKPFADALVARKAGINVHSIHALSQQFEPQLFSPNPRVTADAEVIFRKVCYAGFVLDAKYYTFHGPARLKKQEYVFDYIKIGDRLNQIAAIAQSYGLKLSYENVHWTYASEPSYFKNIFRQCPNVYATLDVKQSLQAGINPLKFLDVMQNRISTIHLCDFKNGETCLPGEGSFNFAKFFRELDHRNINVNMMLEVYPKDYKDIMELKRSYDYLNSLLNEIRNKK